MMRPREAWFAQVLAVLHSFNLFAAYAYTMDCVKHLRFSTLGLY
jgi:hypothetical protein